MDKKKFDKIMDEWVALEMEAAPDLQPSPEVYQKLEEKVKRRKVSFFSWPVRLAAAGIAAALIVLVIVMQPPKEVEPLLGLRKGTVTDMAGREETRDKMQVLAEAETEEQAEKAGKVETAKKRERVEEGIKEEGIDKKEYDEIPAKSKVTEKLEEPKVADKEVLAQPREVAAKPRMELNAVKKDVAREAKRSQIAAAAPAVAVSERVEFQYQPIGSESILSLDVDSPQDEIISLSSEDNYRLRLHLPQERYVYVFQVGADDQLTRLFPNTEYNPVQNPVQAGNRIIIPSSPDWLYMEKGRGEVLIYVVSSAEPLYEWNDIDVIIDLGRLDQIEKDRGDQVSVRVFKFNIQ